MKRRVRQGPGGQDNINDVRAIHRHCSIQTDRRNASSFDCVHDRNTEISIASDHVIISMLCDN